VCGHSHGVERGPSQARHLRMVSHHLVLPDAP
jgi:hypothetical protein